MRCLTRLLVVATALSLAEGCLFGQTVDQVAREAFVRELNQRVLGTSGDPLEVTAGGGWRGVVLAPPGTALSPVLTGFDSFGYDSLSVAKTLEASALFDSTLDVYDGIGYPGPFSIASSWERILDDSRPEGGADGDALRQRPESKWLFRAPDEVDKIRGINYLREPSPYMLDYREFEAASNMLRASEERQDGTWRFNPKLMRYNSIAEAKEALFQDWMLYGYQKEIEGALESYEKAAGAAAWRQWSQANEAFTRHRVELTPYRWAPVTILFPAPSDWLGMSNWIRGEVTLPSANERIRFQLARVRILRPWFEIDALLHKDLKVRRGANEISDGAAPTAINYPKGRLAVYPEELLLVRDIRFFQGLEGAEQPAPSVVHHPLGQFYYAEAVNLLGYVVRALPSIEGPEASDESQ